MKKYWISTILFQFLCYISVNNAKSWLTHDMPKFSVASLQAMQSQQNRDTSYLVPGSFPKLKQEKELDCWAVAATIMVSWKNNQTYKVEEVISQVGEKYLTYFRDDLGLPPSDKAHFLHSLGMRAEAPRNFTLKGWLSLLKEYGLLWVTSQHTVEFSIHARVVYGMRSDGTVENTFLHVFDPETGAEEIESFSDFFKKYENVAKSDLQIRETNPEVDLQPQVIHF